MTRYRVLLVDDEAIILDGMTQLFDWNSHNCEIVGRAMDGISALSKVISLHPDIVVMDINIPFLNGLEVVKKLRAWNQLLRFIIVSGYDDFHYCQDALRLSVDDYILKPVDFLTFGKVVDASIKALEDMRLRDGHLRLQSEDRDRVREMVCWIDQHYNEDITLEKLSDKFHLCGSYISKLFKASLGTNYFSYLTHIRLNKARQLLMTTDHSISEIAELTGYKDYRTFTRAYKLFAGRLPSSDRELNK